MWTPVGGVSITGFAGVERYALASGPRRRLKNFGPVAGLRVWVCVWSETEWHQVISFTYLFHSHASVDLLPRCRRFISHQCLKFHSDVSRMRLPHFPLTGHVLYRSAPLPLHSDTCGTRTALSVQRNLVLLHTICKKATSTYCPPKRLSSGLFRSVLYLLPSFER